jgi:hypothetical protein
MYNASIVAYGTFQSPPVGDPKTSPSKVKPQTAAKRNKNQDLEAQVKKEEPLYWSDLYWYERILVVFIVLIISEGFFALLFFAGAMLYWDIMSFWSLLMVRKHEVFGVAKRKGRGEGFWELEIES